MNFTNLCTKQKHSSTNNTESPRPDIKFSSSRHTKTKHVNSSLLFSFVYFVPNIRTLSRSQHHWMASQKAFSVLERHANTLFSYFFLLCMVGMAWHRPQQQQQQRSEARSWAQHRRTACEWIWYVSTDTTGMLLSFVLSTLASELVRKSRFVIFYCRIVFRYSFVVCLSHVIGKIAGEVSEHKQATSWNWENLQQPFLTLHISSNYNECCI